MDLHCPTCGEPWDRHHLQFDEVHEWGVSREDAKHFESVCSFTGPDDRILKAAQAAGWQFVSNSVFSITHCPCCKRRPALEDATDRRAGVSILSQFLDGDPDALASELAP